MRKKKIISSVLAIIVASAMLLAGCSSKNNDTAKTSDAPKASTAATATDSELPSYEITLAYLNLGSKLKDIQEVVDKMNEITQAKINATVKLLPIEFGAWTQQLNLMIAGNEKLDLMFTANFLNYNVQVAKGQLIPLDELLEKYGQETKKVVDPSILETTQINGQIYGVPSIRDWAADYGLVIRKDMLDKYKIDVTKLKSINDMEPIFKLIKDNEPGMAPVVPVTAGSSIYDGVSQGKYDLLDDGYGVLPDLDNNLKVVDMYSSAQYAADLQMIRKWYLAGYIPKDAATNKEDGASLLKAGKAFSYFQRGKPGKEAQESRTAGMPVVFVPFTPASTTTGNITVGMFSIPKNSQNPERAMMYLDLLYSNKELINLIDNGIEGKHYVKKADNVIDFPPAVDATNTGYLNSGSSWEMGNQTLSYIWAPDSPDLWERLLKFNEESVKSKALGFTFNVESVKTESAAVTNVKNQYKLGLETGTIDPTDKLPEFISKLNAAGIDKIIAEKQRQLDEWAKSKK